MHYCNIKQLRNITKLECRKDIKSWHNKIFLPVLGQAWLFNSQYTKNNINVIFPLSFQRDYKQYFLLGIQGRGKRSLSTPIRISAMFALNWQRISFWVSEVTHKTNFKKSNTSGMSEQKWCCGSGETGACHQHRIEGI